ncbi:MAG: mcrA [Blastococcus sp.]|nr:mcrA [Blastococcus sp.]
MAIQPTPDPRSLDVRTDGRAEQAVPAPRGAVDDLAPGFTDADVDELRRSVVGPVLVAGDEGLPAEVTAWNLAVQHTPAVVVGATCSADVVAAVSWAVAHGLKVAVQATGHGPVRNAAGSLMVTTHRMQGVFIDPDTRIARVQAGVEWATVMRAAAEYGLAGLCGSSSGVGVVGYTLGGGMGSLARKHGFAADSVVSVEIVTADGRLRRVTAESDPELFWALRGGKGNFGIVTALEFELVPVPSLFGGGIFFSAEDAPAVLHRFRAWAPSLPEEVGTSIAILRLPPMEELPPPLRGQTVVHLRFAYSGEDHAEAERLLSPMKTAGTIVLGYVGPMRTDEMDGIHMDPVDPMPAWEKGMLLAELTEETVDTLLAVAGPEVDLPLIMVEIRLMGGALGREAAVPNAVAGRAGAFSMLLIGPLVPELAQVVPAVGKGVLTALMPWCAPGVLTNFLGDVIGPAEVLNAWPAEAQRRLVAVKRAVDPVGVFTFGHAF